MKKRVKISELLDLLEKLEGKRITDSGLRKSLARSGVLVGSDHMVDSAKALEARKASKIQDKAKEQKISKTGKFASVADARVKKISLECDRLQIEIDKLTEKLVERKEVEMSFGKIVQDLKTCVNNWSMRTIATDPAQKERIDELRESFFNELQTDFDI